MRIEVRGRNVAVDDELREHVLKRFRRVGRQVSELATLDIERARRAEPGDRRQPGGRGDPAAQRRHPAAKEGSPEMSHTIHELAEDIRRQVKKHRALRRKRPTPITRRTAGLTVTNLGIACMLAPVCTG